MSQGEYEKKKSLREQNADKKKQRFITFARICSFLLMLSVFVCVLFDSIKKVWYIPILMVMIVTLFAAVWQKKWEKKLFIPLIVATFVLQLFAALLQMLLIGFMAFFMIWETKPRYILHFSLLVLSMASISFETICDWLMKNRRCLREKITDDLHSHFHSARNRWNRIMEFYDRWT